MPSEIPYGQYKGRISELSPLAHDLIPAHAEQMLNPISVELRMSIHIPECLNSTVPNFQVQRRMEMREPCLEVEVLFSNPKIFVMGADVWFFVTAEGQQRVCGFMMPSRPQAQISYTDCKLSVLVELSSLDLVQIAELFSCSLYHLSLVISPETPNKQNTHLEATEWCQSHKAVSILHQIAKMWCSGEAPVVHWEEQATPTGPHPRTQYRPYAECPEKVSWRARCQELPEFWKQYPTSKQV